VGNPTLIGFVEKTKARSGNVAASSVVSKGEATAKKNLSTKTDFRGTDGLALALSVKKKRIVPLGSKALDAINQAQAFARGYKYQRGLERRGTHWRVMKKRWPTQLARACVCFSGQSGQGAFSGQHRPECARVGNVGFGHRNRDRKNFPVEGKGFRTLGGWGKAA